MLRLLRISRRFLLRLRTLLEQEAFQVKRDLRVVGGNQSVGVPHFG
jgi:hypothetical protein